MWYVATASTGICCAAYYYYRTRKPTNLLIQKIENIKKIQDAVRLLQNIARRAPTEDIAALLTNTVITHGIRENAAIRISRLHTQYGGDQGTNGYAINMLWSCIVMAGIERDWVVMP